MLGTHGSEHRKAVTRCPMAMLIKGSFFVGRWKGDDYVCRITTYEFFDQSFLENARPCFPLFFSESRSIPFMFMTGMFCTSGFILLRMGLEMRVENTAFTAYAVFGRKPL